MAQQSIIFHPQFLKERAKYIEISDFVDGDVDLLKSKDYLIPYDSESGNTVDAKRSWASRLRRLSNENECDPPLRINCGHLSQRINFGELASNKTMQSILDDVTGYGMSAQEMLSELFWYFLPHGKVGVLVDGTRADSPSLQQAREIGERSYQVLYSAAQIVYWDVFKEGKQKGNA